MTRCDPGQGGYCGSIERPLDPTNPDSELITVGFEFYPHTDAGHPAVGTLLPQEGGPGYSTTGSGDFYLSIFGPLRKSRDVLIIDKRGTGTSDALDCPQLQSGTGDFQQAVAACARQLGANAYQYGTVLAAGDIAAVLDALGIGQVDFYGDSYGTFFGQVFAALYPQRLRSIVLDSAYPVRPPDVWFGTDWKTAWAGIDLSCSRSLSCRNLGGSASERVRSLIAQIRQTPIQGTAPDENGLATAITLDAPTLLYTLDTAGYGPVIYRDLDAATRAWQQHGDPLPLLRLAAEAETPEVDAPADFSDGLYTAVSCQDYPLLYDLRASKAQRKMQYQEALADTALRRPDLFAPFSFAEGMASQAYITPLDTCLNWPRPPAAVVPGQPLAPAVSFPSVPTLVLSGDLDSVTSPEDAAETSQQFPDAVHLIIPNLPHVTAGSDDLGCVTRILRTFVRTLAPGDTSCIPLVRPIRTVPEFTVSSAELEPIAPLADNRASTAELRVAAAALESVGDVIARSYYFVSAGAGLRGGTFRIRSTNVGYDFTLHNIRWTKDLAVSGTATWGANAKISAQVTLVRDGQAIGSLMMSWSDGDIEATATVDGTINAHRVHGTRIAP